MRPDLRLLLGCVLAGLLPFALIWCVNTLFTTAIAYTLKTWVAALVLYGVLKPYVETTK